MQRRWHAAGSVLRRRLRVHRSYLFDQALGTCARSGDRRPVLANTRPRAPACRDPRQRGRPRPPAGRARPGAAPPRSAGVGPQRARDRRHARPAVAHSGARSRGSRPSSRSRPHLSPAAGRRAPVPAVLAFFGGPSASAASTIRRRMPPTDVAPSTPMSRSSRSITRSRPSTAIPSQVEQAYAALVWLFEHAEELGVDPERIGVHRARLPAATSPPR